MKAFSTQLLLILGLACITFYANGITPGTPPPVITTADSLALIAIYNTNGGASWSNNTNWTLTTPDQWHGVAITGNRVTALDLSFNNLSGDIPLEIGNLTALLNLNLSGNSLTSVPAEMVNLTSLTQLNLSNNQLTTIPDLSTLPLTGLDVSSNSLTFESLEPNVAIPGFKYNPQSNVNPGKEPNFINLGASFTFDVTIGGSANQYQWTKNGTNIPGATSSGYSVASASLSDGGNYQLNVTNTLVPGLTIKTIILPVSINFTPLNSSDSLALVALYNSTNGPGWTNNTNWLTGPAQTWYGITTNSGSVTGISLPSNNLTGSIPPELGSMATSFSDLDLSFNKLTGAVPPELTGAGDLHYVNLSNNGLTGSFPHIPYMFSLDISNNQFTGLPNLNQFFYLGTLYVQNNKLTFKDLELNTSVSDFSYSPQDSIDVTRDTLFQINQAASLPSKASGTANSYQWSKNKVAISGATNATLDFASLQVTDEGDYSYAVTSTLLPLLTLYSHSIGLRISSLQRDSTALVQLYNATGGANWTTHTNWTTKPITSGWSGVTITNNRVSDINLSGNNMKGDVPISITDIQFLKTINFSSNALTSIPDLTSLVSLTSVNVSSNNLDFASMLPNVTVPGIDYSKQALLGTALDILVDVGTDYALNVTTGGTGNAYQWKLNNIAVSGANSSDYTISNINRGNMGTYVCEVTNPGVAGVVLQTANQRVRAIASLSGKIIINNTTPISSGNVLLFKINNAGAYDTTAIQPINKDGTFAFSQVVLDDYELLGKPDVTAFSSYLPTYYDGQLFWEDADTLHVTSSMTNLNITVQSVPVPSTTGKGSISGTVTDDNSSNRFEKVEGGRVVGGATVSARRETSASRIESTYVLAASSTTDANGQFTLTNLDPGTYLFNVQFPGYPMDAGSNINLVIGSDPGNRQAVVEAVVTGGKIVVTISKITGLESDVAMQAYPNPAQERIMITSEFPLSASQLEVHDMNGGAITLPVKTETNGLDVDVRSLTKGLYIFTVMNNNGKPVYSAKVSVN